MKKRIEIKDFRYLNPQQIIEVHTITGNIISCMIRTTSTSTTSNQVENSPSAGVGILGYTLLNETENDIYINKLEMKRSIPFNQIKSIYLIQ